MSLFWEVGSIQLHLYLFFIFSTYICLYRSLLSAFCFRIYHSKIRVFCLLTYFLPLLLSLNTYSQSINTVMFIRILNKSQFSTFYSQGTFLEATDAAVKMTNKNSVVTGPPPTHTQEFHQPGKIKSCHGRGDQKVTPHPDTLCPNYHTSHLFF